MRSTLDLALTSKALRRFETDLQQRRSELISDLERLQREIRALGDSGGSDPLDDACGISSMEATFATYTQRREQLRNVELALQRIADGNFGMCDTCGRPVGLKRLQALPWANHCITCQEQSEQSRVHSLSAYAARSSI